MGRGTCPTVEYLATTVREAKNPDNPVDRLLLELLRLMPLYRDIGRLDIWERTVQDVWPDEETPLGRLVEGIFELGRYNLYSAFDQEGLDQEYRKVIELLGSDGIFIDEPSQISGW